MKATKLFLLSAAMIGLACLAPGCTAVVPGDGEPGPPEPAADALPDFSLRDVNPASARYGEEIFPRDYLGEVSAWYFGHST